ncbi:MAG TPA: Calx-beta domain-containing protein [Thermoanaerobaculia bacterium]|nr:Calx-beta domain-containing protein [Thermoanaerobaculia bacterium]
MLSPYEPYQRTLPAGSYYLAAEVSTAIYPKGLFFYSSFLVGHGLVSVKAERFDIPEGSPASFTISRTDTDVATTAGWLITDDRNSRTPTTDLSPATGSVTLAAGQASQAVSVPTSENPLFREGKTYYMWITTATNGYFSDAKEAPFGVREKDMAVIDFADRPLTVSETAGSAAIKVQRTGFLGSPVDVRYDVREQFTSGVLKFAPGETVKTFNVPIYNDHMWSGGRDIELQLSALPLHARFPNDALTNPARLTILEAEPTPRLTVTDISIAEGSSSSSTQAMFTVRLSPRMPSLDVYYDLIDETAKGGSDYSSVVNGSLHLSEFETEMRVVVPIAGDSVREPHETFKLRIRGTSNPNIVLPPDATCTILNDDPLLTPSSARIAKGQSQRFSLDIGLPASSALSVPLSVTDPSIVGVPASVPFSAGQSTATFDVTGTAAGSTQITAKLPLELGGNTFEATVMVHETGTAVFEPEAITVVAGDEATVKVSLKPASAQEQRLQLTSGNSELATMPADVVVPAGGSGTFKVKGLAPGATYVKAFLPAQFGEGYVIALLDVVERPATPAITSIEPASGLSAGGTPFLARGALLTGDCTLLFGGVPATALSLTSEGMLTGTTPPHASGAADVTLTCGTNTFVLTNAFTYTAPSRTRSARH